MVIYIDFYETKPNLDYQMKGLRTRPTTSNGDDNFNWFLFASYNF